MHIKSRSATSALLHNARVYKLSYAIANTEKNYTEYTLKIRDIQQMMKSIKTDYKKHSYRGRRLPSNSTPIKEGVLNLNGEHTNEEVMKVAKKIAKKLGVQLMGVSIHRDEGYVDIQGKKHFNYHAHLLFNYYDFQKHKIVHQTNEQMKQMQTLIAEELKMERGVPKSETKRKHIEHGQYRAVAKEKSEAIEKALEVPKLTISSLKAEIERLRKEMAEAKQFTKEDYQALNKIKKITKKATLEDAVDQFFLFKRRIELEKEKLEIEARKKDLTIEALKAELEEKEEDLSEKEEFLSTAVEAQEKFRSYAQTYQKKLIEAQNELEEQKIENTTLKQENSTLKAIVSEISSYLKCTKDQIVEKVKNLFQKEEEPEEEVVENDTGVPINLSPESKRFEYISAEDDDSTPLDHLEIIENSKIDPLVEKTKEKTKADLEWEEVVRKNLGNQKNPSMF